ncbi:uncharacterized protein LOC111364433 [Spodoptera litura]|uniref:Uncharacterized protein LOC111364433 n=1 Tax=Spodoptera litura TaxID=69820 RepID=A0A9J7J5W3_SPOLT|nr:uncharacterized protein LOC111364433 [Spodoptera litura]
MEIDETAVSGEIQPTTDRPTPADFDKYLPWACAQLSAEADVVVIRSLLKTYQSSATSERSAKSKKSKPKPSSILTPTSGTDFEEKTSKFDKNLMGADKYITVETVYDSLGNLVQLKFLNNIVPIPAKVIKMIGLLIPFQKHLTNITINSGMHADTIYEISKYLSSSHITELCLDGAFIPEANYDLLLTECHLKYLSLSKCKINDTVVKTIVNKLYFTLPASNSLSALSLATNGITDVGAKYLADVLRSNRKLSYLNLADNMIGDEGAMSILDVLQNFRITTNELRESRSRYMKYLKIKIELVASLITGLNETEVKKVVKKKNNKTGLRRNRSLDRDITTPRSSMDRGSIIAHEQYLRDRARSLAEAKLGGFQDPFSLTNTEEKDGCFYCYGNNTLSYLNIAYNNISHITIKRLYEVLVTQKYFNRNPRGLVNVVIEGNNLPMLCVELQGINNIIGSNLNNIQKATNGTMKKKSVAGKPSGKQSIIS